MSPSAPLDPPKPSDLGHRAQPRLAVLCRAGQRPTWPALQAMVAGSPGIMAMASPNRAELFAEGLAFTVKGLAPGSRAAVPAFRHSYGFGDRPDPTGLEAIVLAPAHRVGRGDGLIPAVRALLGLGSQLAAWPAAAAVAWLPAATVMECAHFCRLTKAWLDGGAFPGLGLTALTVNSAGARSTGLALFAGHEIVVSGAESAAANAKLALRVIHVLADPGFSGYDALGRITDGELRWAFSANRRILRIRQVSGGTG